MGGVTAVFEMPNTKPPTTTAEAVAEKVALGQDRMHCDFAFYVGGTPDNAETLPDLEKLPGVCGVKVFMGSSTGNLLVADDDGVGRILKAMLKDAQPFIAKMSSAYANGVQRLNLTRLKHTLSGAM